MLQREIELSTKDHEKDWIFNTIYFGGGSPARLSSKSMQDIIQQFKDVKLQNRFNPSRYVKKFNYTNWKNSVNKEDEIKKNTDDINKEKINLLFNKISNNTFSTMYENLLNITSERRLKNEYNE